MTPHLNAKPNDFAETCLLPGDPLRAKFVADTFLQNVRLVSDVRNMLAYTGEYKGVAVSVMGTGMGIPSISIYAKELITEYGVKNLIRVGSCGAVNNEIELNDIIVASGACTDSSVNRTRFAGMDFAAVPDFLLTSSMVEQAGALGHEVHIGNIFSADLFYTTKPELFSLMEKMGVLGVEMEAAGLFGVAAEFGAKAATICTVSDHILKGGELSSDQRQSSFSNMMQIALEAAISVG